MAQGRSGEDNPVALNVAPMVDIIFCLCIFFMCSFHFKQLEGKIDSWLPKNHGVHPEPVSNPVLEEVRVVMTWDSGMGEVTRRIGGAGGGLGRGTGDSHEGRDSPIRTDRKDGEAGDHRRAARGAVEGRDPCAGPVQGERAGEGGVGGCDAPVRRIPAGGLTELPAG